MNVFIMMYRNKYTVDSRYLEYLAISNKMFGPLL